MGRILFFAWAGSLLCGGDLSPSELIERMRPSAAGQFKKAWTMAHGGTAEIEVVVLISKAADGSYDAAIQPLSNRHHRGAFRFHRGVVAIFHTHPKSVQPQPSGPDRRLADRLKVPVATMTADGLFVYDPATRKTGKMMDSLYWLDAANWGRVQATSTRTASSRR